MSRPEKVDSLKAIKIPNSINRWNNHPDTRDSVDICNEIIEKNPDTYVISISDMYVKMWDWVLGNPCIHIPATFPPSLFADWDEPKTNNNYRMDGFFTAIWSGTSSFGNGSKIMMPLFNQLRVYMNSVQENIESMSWNDKTIFGIMIMNTFHLLFHEISHFIRTYEMWEKCYSDTDPDPYEVSLQNLRKFLGNSGTLADEKATEELAIQLCTEFAFGYNLHSLKPKIDGPYIQHLRKRNESIDINCAYYALKWYDLMRQINYEDYDEGPLLAEQDKLIEKMQKACKKHGKKWIIVK